jgi:hypothetical protein
MEGKKEACPLAQCVIVLHPVCAPLTGGVKGRGCSSNSALATHGRKCCRLATGVWCLLACGALLRSCLCCCRIAAQRDAVARQIESKAEKLDVCEAGPLECA